LQAVLLLKRGLQRVQLVAIGKTFNRSHIRSMRLRSQYRATLDGSSIDMHHTCTALARIAADMRAGQSQFVTQQIDQQCAVLNLGFNLTPVYA
jgi:hypothetical protein